MKPVRLLSLLVPFGALFGAQACLTDNPAAYNGILGRSVRAELDDAGTTAAGGTGVGGGAGGPAGGASPATTGGTSAGKGGTGGGGGKGTGGGSGGKIGRAHV